MSDKKTLEQMYQESRLPTCDRNMSSVAMASALGAKSGFDGPKGMSPASIPVRVASGAAQAAVKGAQAYQKETQRMHDCFSRSAQEQVMTYNRPAPVSPANLPPVQPMIFSPLITTRQQAQQQPLTGNDRTFAMMNRWR